MNDFILKLVHLDFYSLGLHSLKMGAEAVQSRKLKWE